MKKKEDEIVIEVKKLHRHYHMGETIVKALRGVDVKIRRGDFIFIVGPSGSGKTTLQNMIGALDTPSKGDVVLEGTPLSEMDDWQLSMIRRNKIGFIFQAFNLIPSLDCVDNVTLPMMTEKKIDEAVLKAKAMTLLKDVGLGERMTHTPNQLSGGERQRVAIARALINDPDIILADEPTGELDSMTGESIMQLLRKMNKEHNTTMVVVTHDEEYIRKGDHVLMIKDGALHKTYRKK